MVKRELLMDVRKPAVKAAAELDGSVAASLGTLMRVDRVDLFELCCTEKSTLGEAMIAAGGSVLRMGLWNDYDFSKTKTVEKAIADIDAHRPLHVHGSPPCTPWTIMQNINQRTEEQCARLAKQRRWGRRVILNVLKVLSHPCERMPGLL